MSLRCSLLVALCLLMEPKAFGQTGSAHDPDNEVVVVGTRSARALKDSTVPVRVISRKELDAAGDITAADALARTPGVLVHTSYRGQTVEIQGLSSKHVLVLVDGKRVLGRLGDEFDLSRIPAEQIERIEILKGASSVLYGSDAIGGVINVIMRRPKKGWRARARTSHDSLGRDELSLTSTGGYHSLHSGLGVVRQQGPAYDLNKSDLDTTANAYDKLSGTFEVGVDVNDDFSLAVEFSRELLATSGVSTRGRAIIDRASQAAGGSAKVSSSYHPGEHDELRFELYESQYNVESTEDQRRATDLDRRQFAAERLREASVIFSREFNPQHLSIIGAETQIQSIESDRVTDAGRGRARHSGFLQHEWRPGSVPGLRIVPGWRIDRDSQFGVSRTKALALRFDLTPEIVWRLSYGEGYRAPSFTELLLDFQNPSVGYRVAGNPELRPERSKSVQTGLTWEPWSLLWMSLSIFENRVRDLIAANGQKRDGEGTLLYTYANQERVLTRGVEVSGRLRVRDQWTLGLDYTFLRARDETKARTLAGRPQHSGTAQVYYSLPASGWGASLTTNFVGKRPVYVEGVTGEVTDWAAANRLSNLRLHKKWGQIFEIFGGIRNITNEYDSMFNPVAPRSYFTGIGATF